VSATSQYKKIVYFINTHLKIWHKYYLYSTNGCKQQQDHLIQSHIILCYINNFPIIITITIIITLYHQHILYHSRYIIIQYCLSHINQHDHGHHHHYQRLNHFVSPPLSSTTIIIVVTTLNAIIIIIPYRILSLLIGSKFH